MRLYAKICFIFAGVMELVDMQDLGSCVERRGGSSPFARTKKEESLRRFFFFTAYAKSRMPIGVEFPIRALDF